MVDNGMHAILAKVVLKFSGILLTAEMFDIKQLTVLAIWPLF